MNSLAPGRIFLLFLSLGLAGCSAFEWVGMRLVFDEETLPEHRVVEDLTYVAEDAHPERHRFNLYLPEGEDWPTLIFVHGGGWTEGHKDLRAGGFQIYGNIGAVYAQRGIGVATINSRLQPDVDWRDQVRDVARAVASIRREVDRRGGDPAALFVAGHSAGAQLAAFTAVADWPLREAEDAGSLCGVVAVSGAGYDLADARTYELDADPRFYAARFRSPDAEPEVDWQGPASVTHHLDPSDPPFLVFFATLEYSSLKHQAKLLHERLQEAEIPSRLVEVPRQGHRQIVATLSQARHPMVQEVIRFVEENRTSCRSGSMTGAP